MYIVSVHLHPNPEFSMITLIVQGKESKAGEVSGHVVLLPVSTMSY